MSHNFGRPYSVNDWVETALRAMPATIRELTEITGRPKGTMKHWLYKLRSVGWAHVGGWKRSPGPGKKQPVFKAGPGKDKPPPPNIPLKDSVDRSRAKARQDGRYEFQLAKARAAKKVARIRKRGIPATPFDALLR
ncbi:hypothetical protein [Aquabacterium sp.]|uniref:hypothetical protein n=1 Tax=Aquabacterium sp. TaxID=1872578 RepID=UPI0025C4987A|nr:hypothetical protein [Aquabacterium sp.]